MIALLAAVIVQADPADLFRRAAKAVEDAPSLRAEARSEITREGAAACTATWQLLSKGDRARVQAKASRGGASRESRIFITGTRGVEFDDGKRLDPEDVHRETARRHRAALGRIGLAALSYLANTVRYEKKGRNDVPDVGSLSFGEFALAGEEQTGGRPAWRITCRAEMRSATIAPLAVTAWIDRERVVPVRFSITVRERDATVTIVESLSLDLNFEIPDADFLPPEK